MRKAILMFFMVFVWLAATPAFAQEATSVDCVDCIGSRHLKPDAVGYAHLKDDSVGSTQLKNDSVGGAHLKPGSVKANKIADGTITASKIAPRVLLEGPAGPPGADGATSPQGPAGPQDLAGVDGTSPRAHVHELSWRIDHGNPGGYLNLDCGPGYSAVSCGVTAPTWQPGYFYSRARPTFNQDPGGCEYYVHQDYGYEGPPYMHYSLMMVCIELREMPEYTDHGEIIWTQP